MKKLLIVDGSLLLFQSFYGMPKQILNSQGKRIEAVICFIGILRKVIKMVKADYVYVVFDGENKLERQEENKSYKANRTDFSLMQNEDTPFEQLLLIEKILKYLNINFNETVNIEADDEIAGIVKNYQNDFEIIILSQDKDLFQLINKNVSVFCYRGKKSINYNLKLFKEKYGFLPEYFNSYKALIGDASDNISGVKGIGPKRATQLIKEYKTVNEIILNINNIENSIIKTAVLTNKSKILSNFSIINLNNAKKIYGEIKPGQ